MNEQTEKESNCFDGNLKIKMLLTSFTSFTQYSKLWAENELQQYHAFTYYRKLRGILSGFQWKPLLHENEKILTYRCEFLKRNTKTKKELIVEENQEELSSRPNQAAKKESLPITRKSATHDEIPQHKSHDAEQSGNIGSNDPVVLGFHEEEDHKLAARQIEDETSDVNRDEFVAILQRQRDDLIAASRVAESPLPVENMRVNMNSGL
ncbi:uncharacterized protein LOC142230792 [Haematobia irritans]|uniref:uncharacterized protein LOC142230792 n=1 Tax=Haematobia irritans TaxID=7368 RepID=UPI003F4FAAAC